MKKSVVMCLAIIMCMFAVTGSIAYFTDSVQVQGEVKSGNLDIEQAEYERVKDATTGAYTAELQAYRQNQPIYPSVHPSTSSERTDITVTTPDNQTITAKLNQDINGYVDKIVVATNHGSLNTYVRTFVAVPTVFDQAIHLDWNHEGGWSAVSTSFSDKITVADYQINNVDYTIYYVTNENPLTPGASAPPSLLGFYLDPQVNHNGTNYILGDTELGTGSELKILVASVASQVIPTGIGDTPRDTATDAMDKTYDTPAAGNHPWATED